MCADATCGVLVSSPSCSPLPGSPHSFLFLTQKINQGCHAAGAVHILPSGATSVWARASDQKANAFPSAPEFLSLSDSVVQASEGGDREHAAGLLEVGTRTGESGGLNEQFAEADLI